jgi:hypothetical protein
MSQIIAAQGSRIYTLNGCKEALSIKEDDLISLDYRLCLDPDLEPAHALVEDARPLTNPAASRTALSITTEKGYRTVLHPSTMVMTARGLKLAAELTEEDCVLLMTQSPLGYDATTSETMYMDEEEGASLLEDQYNIGRILGWLVGDGTIRKSAKQTQYILYFCHNDIPLAHYFAEQLGGVSVGIQTNNGSPNNTKTATVNIPVKLMPTRYTSKDEIDADMYSMPVETIRGYLRGLFSADASVDKYTILLSQSNEARLVTVQKLLLHFGIVSSISLRSEAGTYNWTKEGKVIATGPKKANYSLIISGWNCNQFLSEIGFDVEAKSDKLTAQADKRSQKSQKAETFCVGVEKIEVLEDHNFKVLEVYKPYDTNSILAYSSDGILCVTK